MELVRLASEMEVGETKSIAFGMTHKDIYRENESLWILSDTVDGWVETEVTLVDLSDLGLGIKDLTDLDWV